MSAPPIAYFGGKQTVASQIVSLLPTHLHYVEPFAGSLAVLLAKGPSRAETVNDLDRALMTFWRVLRDEPDTLMRACALTPHSRAERELARDLDDVDDVETARRVWVALTQGRAGQLRPTGWRHLGAVRSTETSPARVLKGYLQRMPAAIARLRSVSLECRPALEVIDDYGRHPSVLLYVDPPYLSATRGSSSAYRHEMRTAAHHAELLDVLEVTKASVVLSGYANDLYDRRLAHWCRVEVPSFTGQGAARRPGARTEVLWSNAELTYSPTLDMAHGLPVEAQS